MTFITIKAGDLTERDARMAWAYLTDPGDVLAAQFVASHNDARAALITLVELANAGKPGTAHYAEGVESWGARLPGLSIDRIKLDASRFGIGFLIPGDDEWPTEKLARLDVAPFGLFYRGDASLLTTPIVAIVGARAATGYGEHVTMELSAGLTDRGYTIVSGAAYGIDGMAHRAALASHGKTIAVLAGGVDRFYPSGHDALLTRIVETGLVISELPPGSAPTKWRFLQRNRIIAALSQAVIVTEAGYRSGSLNTVGHANAIGVPVGAYPGPVTSAASAGCHRVIREGGAKLVSSPDEAAELAPIAGESE